MAVASLSLKHNSLFIVQCRNRAIFFFPLPYSGEAMNFKLNAMFGNQIRGEEKRKQRERGEENNSLFVLWLIKEILLIVFHFLSKNGEIDFCGPL